MLITRRALLGGAASVFISHKADAAFWQGQAYAVNSPAWYTIPVGGGGYQSRLSISPSGTILSGSDAFFIGTGSTKLGTPNVQLQTGTSMPASFLPSPYIGGDCYDLVIGPSGNFWWYWSTTSIGTLLKSTNQGANWQTTGFPITAANGNGNSHTIIRQMIAEDPNNANVVYVGGYDALRVSFNGGATFTTVSGITAPGSDPGVCAIQFDPTSGTTTNGGVTVTARILLSVYGTGIYVSTNGGASFSKITSSPTGVTSSCMGTDGNYYACSYNVSSLVRISTANALTTISCNVSVGMMIVNPNNPAQGIAWDAFGGGCITFNGAINSGSPTGTHNGGGSGVSIVANDCPWLELTGNPSLGPIDWDPFLTTSATSLTIGTGSKTLTVATNQNIAINDPIRVSNTGTLTNYMRGLVTAYTPATGSLTFTVGNDDPSQYLGAADRRQRNLLGLERDQRPRLVCLWRRAALYGRAVLQRASDLQQSNIRDRDAVVLRRAVASWLRPDTDRQRLSVSDPDRQSGRADGRKLGLRSRPGHHGRQFRLLCRVGPEHDVLCLPQARFTRAPIKG